jgi:hypothetical protein
VSIFCASVFGDLGYSYFWCYFWYGRVAFANVEMSSGAGIAACGIYWLVARSGGLYSMPSLLAAQPPWPRIGLYSQSRSRILTRFDGRICMLGIGAAS